MFQSINLFSVSRYCSRIRSFRFTNTRLRLNSVARTRVAKISWNLVYFDKHFHRQYFHLKIMRLIIDYFPISTIRWMSHRFQCVAIVCEREEAPISRAVVRQCCGWSCSGRSDWSRHHLCGDSCCSRSEYYSWRKARFLKFRYFEILSDASKIKTS